MPPRIAGYERLVEIGRGGFAVVYRAHDIRFRRSVAIKVLPAGLDENHRVAFERECQAMGSVSQHPSCVSVYDSGFTDDGAPYLVMEFVTGGSLADRLDLGPLCWAHAFEIGVSLAGALQTAHDAGVLHRDVKPENVLISEFGEFKLADFGIARLEDRTLTRSGQSFTPMHAAPEILDGERATVASDVYSLGSTIYTTVAGVPPFFRENDDSRYALIARVLQDATPDLRPAGIPSDVCTALETALSKEPRDRPRSAAALGQLFQSAQASSGEPMSRLIIRSDVGDATGSTAGAESAPEISPELQRARTPWISWLRKERSSARFAVLTVSLVLVVALAVTAAIAIVTAAIVLTRDRDLPPRLTIRVGSRPKGVAVGEGDVWVSNGGDATVSRIDSAGGGKVVATVSVGAEPSGVAVGHGAVWVANRGEDTVSRIDPRANDVVSTIRVGDGPTGVAVGAGAIWVTNRGDGTVSKIDPSNTDKVIPIEVGVDPAGVAVGAGVVWVANRGSRTVSKIDPDNTDNVIPIEVGQRPVGVAADDRSVWVTTIGDRVLRIDPDRETVVESIKVGRDPSAVAPDDGDAWVADRLRGTISHIGRGSNRVVATRRAGRNAGAVAVGVGAVWVVNDVDQGTVSRLQP